jgi:nucleoside-diphosphate-sugar epimerase
MGDGSQVRDYVHVLDVAEAFYTVLTRGGSGETYNCCSGEPVRLDQLVDWVAEAMGILAFSKELLPTYPGDIHEWYGDGGKLANLGFVPRIALGQGIKETVRSYLNATR